MSDEIVLLGGVLDRTIVAGRTKAETVKDGVFDWTSIMYRDSGEHDKDGRPIFRPVEDAA